MSEHFWKIPRWKGCSWAWSTCLGTYTAGSAWPGHQIGSHPETHLVPEFCAPGLLRFRAPHSPAAAPSVVPAGPSACREGSLEAVWKLQGGMQVVLLDPPGGKWVQGGPWGAAATPFAPHRWEGNAFTREQGTVDAWSTQAEGWHLMPLPLNFRHRLSDVYKAQRFVTDTQFLGDCPVNVHITYTCNRTHQTSTEVRTRAAGHRCEPDDWGSRLAQPGLVSRVPRPPWPLQLLSVFQTGHGGLGEKWCTHPLSASQPSLRSACPCVLSSRRTAAPTQELRSCTCLGFDATPHAQGLEKFERALHTPRA